MKKKTVWVFSFALLLMFAFSYQKGSISLHIASAYADQDSSKDKDNSENKNDSGDKDDSADKDGQVTLCHVPPGNPGGKHTLSVGEAALSSHFGHGDSQGECVFCICPPGVASCVCPDGSPGTVTPPGSTKPSSQRGVFGK